MNKNELTSEGKDTIRRSKQPTVITTAKGDADPTEEVTVYVTDLHVFVTHYVGRLTNSAASGLLCVEMDYSKSGKGRVSILGQRCQESQVPV